MQFRFLGSEPGATVHRCSTGRLVRSSVLLTRESASLFEVALQRIEGWRGGRTPPLGGPLPPLLGFRGASRTRAHRTRTDIGSRPTRWRFDALRVIIRRAIGIRPRGRTSALLALPCPFRDTPQQPRTAASLPAGPKTNARLVPRYCLSWDFVPYDTISDWRIRCSRTTDPSAVACHVRGLATSFAASTTSPPGARSAGASLSFALQGVPFGARGAPLGVPALLTLPTVPPPEGSES
jgi:hypothetical protein